MENLTIVKVGGKVVEDPAALQKLLSDFIQIEGHKLLVHGGGKTATQISEKLGIGTKMLEGRRITDLETLKVVTMVYAGLVNKNIVVQLQALGSNALGLTGADLNLIRSVKRPVKDVDYGYVGDIVNVNADILSKLIDEGIIPVVAPLTHDGKGQILNTNADTVTTKLAIALSKHFNVTLIYCFEKKGVLSDPADENSVIPVIDTEKFDTFKLQGIITEGMIPKLDNGFDALQNGVYKVFIASVESLFQKKWAGTELLITQK
jgi:acetylglutamate kinase